jgi:hypothetical protein
LELLFTATLLAFVSYALLRGPFNRLARLFFVHSRREQLRKEPEQGRAASMSNEAKPQDWSKPAAMAIPKGGFFPDRVEQGRFGPVFPKTPAGYGFSIVAKVIPGREEVFYQYAKDIERTVAESSQTASLFCSFTTFAGFSFRSRERPTSCIKASSTPTSTNIPKTRWRCLE